MMTIGIDTHKATLAVSVIDATGRECRARTFPNERQGHLRLLEWTQELAAERRFGVEGSGSFGAAPARLLISAGVMVVEVPAVLTDRERRHLRRAGRSDPGAPLAIARVALREEGLGPIPMPGLTEDLKLLVDARDQRVGERTRLANRLHANLVVLAAGYKRPNLAGSSHWAALARLLDDLVGVRADLARADLARLRELDAECAALEKRIRSLVRLSGSSLPTITGVAVITAAKLLGETGDPRRIRSAPGSLR